MTKISQTEIAVARKKRDAGMKQAEDHANAHWVQWSETALEFLKGYAEINPKFMIEDVRFASQGIVPPPPSQRAWGSITAKAVRNGWIHNDNHEFSHVKNRRAHRANAAVWKSNIVKYSTLIRDAGQDRKAIF